ncbi:helix-turn-helix domain-containing protein [Streptomyces sp. NBC_01320]|uniref:helix-turn-helix domain-containing protein n=1 Tax=Streptomyces sp. NBC_01320 TaxID=2903824 RepID=UPI002E0D720C
MPRSRVVEDAEVLALRHENAVLRRQIARVRYESADRIWPAVLSRLVPRERWRQVFAVTPTTLLARRRRLVSRKWTLTERRHPGRPPTAPTVRQLILRLARENSTWGHRRIQGELVRLGYSIAPSTVWEILQSSGVDPAPHRSGPTWRQFLTTQAHGIIAADFLHLDTVALGRLYALIFCSTITSRVITTDCGTRRGTLFPEIGEAPWLLGQVEPHGHEQVPQVRYRCASSFPHAATARRRPSSYRSAATQALAACCSMSPTGQGSAAAP